MLDRGRRCCSSRRRRKAAARRDARAPARRRRARCATTARPAPSGWRAGTSTARAGRWSRAHPIREPGHRSSGTRSSVERDAAALSAPGTSSSRAPRAPRTTRRPARWTSGHLPHRGRAAAGRRRDGLRRRLPAADPPDRRGQPQGPEQHPGRRPGRPGLAVGDRLARTAATTPSTPTSARSRTSTPSSPRPASSAWRSPSTSRCSARPDHPWVTEHPEWFTTRADGTIAYAENPPKKYQDIYPLNFDNDPDGLCAEVLRIVRLWIGHGVRSSGSTTRTPSRCGSGSG